MPRLVQPARLELAFGSLLIDVGEATSRVSRLMGHANEAITGAIYTHEIERRDNSERTRAKMREAFGSGVKAEGEAEVVELAVAR